MTAVQMDLAEFVRALTPETLTAAEFELLTAAEAEAFILRRFRLFIRLGCDVSRALSLAVRPEIPAPRPEP